MVCFLIFVFWFMVGETISFQILGFLFFCDMRTKPLYVVEQSSRLCLKALSPTECQKARAHPSSKSVSPMSAATSLAKICKRTPSHGAKPYKLKFVARNNPQHLSGKPWSCPHWYPPPNQGLPLPRHRLLGPPGVQTPAAPVAPAGSEAMAFHAESTIRY